MLIIPNLYNYDYKFLMPVKKTEWMPSSQSIEKDLMGNTDLTCFCVKAKIDDGFVVWKGLFYSREDFDAFLYALMKGTLKNEKYLWSLSTPNWHPEIAPEEHLRYEFATYVYLTSSPGTNVTYTKPADWKPRNTIHTIGAGGAGGITNAGGGPGGRVSGGGGGAYSSIIGFSFGGASTTTRQVGAAAASTAGGDTWFGGTTFALSSVGAKGGAAGVGTGGASNPGGGTGGAAASCIGSLAYDGGSSGSLSTAGASGGGGAAGPYGAGNDSNNISSLWSASNGGSGGAGFGGAGGVVASPPVAAGAGTEFSTSPAYGSGGGGAGENSYNTNPGNQTGGAYGGGGGGTRSETTGAVSPAGGQGLIVIVYSPVTYWNNNPMLGM